MASKYSKPQENSSPPPFYEATQDIYLGHPDSGAMPVCAFRKGDQVHPGIVEAHNLGGQVKVPERFAGAAEPPQPQEQTPEAVTPADGATAEIAPSASALPDQTGQE